MSVMDKNEAIRISKSYLQRVKSADLGFTHNKPEYHFW